jgi:hypothetical protein
MNVLGWWSLGLWLLSMLISAKTDGHNLLLLIWLVSSLVLIGVIVTSLVLYTGLYLQAHQAWPFVPQ